MIKVEKDHFQMSPLPPDFAIDFNDSNKHFGATEPNIKVEHDIDFGQADFESLEGLIQHYELTQHTPATTSPLQNVAIEDVKPDINKNEKDFSSDTTAVPSIPTGICLQLSEEDMMYIYKLEMSFENSFASIPHMGAETNEIWDFISQSWNFRKVTSSSTLPCSYSTAVTGYEESRQQFPPQFHSVPRILHFQQNVTQKRVN